MSETEEETFQITPSVTQRGFTVFSFKDRYDEPCSIQKSSLATEDAIWFGLDKDNQRMHLTQDQVKSLLPILQTFAETGELPEILEW